MGVALVLQPGSIGIATNSGTIAGRPILKLAPRLYIASAFQAAGTSESLLLVRLAGCNTRVELGQPAP